MKLEDQIAKIENEFNLNNRMARRRPLFVSEAVFYLGQSIAYDFEDWIFTEYTVSMKKKDIGIWIASGLLFIDFYPANCGAFNLFEKIYLRKCIALGQTNKALSTND